MQKELDLTTARIASKKYDIEKLKRKSINTEKKMIYGELYRGKRVDKRHIKRTGIIVAGMIAMLISSKTANKAEVFDTYDRVLDQAVQNEMAYSDAVEFLESHDISKRKIYDTYIDAVNSLDDQEYTFFGDRKDGTHNDTMPFDPNSLVNLSDKQKDAIDVLVENEIDEYKRGK